MCSSSVYLMYYQFSAIFIYTDYDTWCVGVWVPRTAIVVRALVYGQCTNEHGDRSPCLQGISLNFFKHY